MMHWRSLNNMKTYYKNVLHTIEDAINSIDEKQYESLLKECENIIHNGGKIIASGLGKNVPICEKFVGTMTSLSLPSCFLHTNTAMHGDLGYVTDKDLLIILTKSGNTDESVILAKYVKESRKTKTWLLTMGNNTKVEPYVNNTIHINMDNEGDEWNIVPNNSTSIYLIILQGIAIELAKRLGITLKDFKINHPGGAIGKKLS